MTMYVQQLKEERPKPKSTQWGNINALGSVPGGLVPSRREALPWELQENIGTQLGKAEGLFFEDVGQAVSAVRQLSKARHLRKGGIGEVKKTNPKKSSLSSLIYFSDIHNEKSMDHWTPRKGM